jgi:outer membrane translocation and assembly module TamA
LLDLYLVANKTSEEKKKAIFLLKIGEELLTVYRSKRKADKSDTYEEIRKMLETHVKPNTVVFTEVMVFRRAARHEGETANEFAIRLRQLAKNCQFKEGSRDSQQFVAHRGTT